MPLLDTLKQLPPHKLFYLLVDGHMIKSDQGWKPYEARETGCVKDFFNALAYATSNLDETAISVKFLRTLHALASVSALKKSPQNPGDFYKNVLSGFFGGMISGGHSIILPKKNLTVAGILQFINFQKNHAYLYTGGFQSRDTLLTYETIAQLALAEKCTEEEYVAKFIEQIDNTVTIQLIQPDNIEERVAQLLEEFNVTLMQAPEEEKERVIVHYIQLLELFHPFPDVNNRTFINLLLCRLNLQHGLNPAILSDYNIFDGHSVDEILALLKEGRARFELLKTDAPVFDYDNEKMPEEDKLALEEYTKEFREGISAELQQKIDGLEFRFEMQFILKNLAQSLEKTIESFTQSFPDTQQKEVVSAILDEVYTEISCTLNSDAFINATPEAQIEKVRELKCAKSDQYQEIYQVVLDGMDKGANKTKWSDQSAQNSFMSYFATKFPQKGEPFFLNLFTILDTISNQTKDFDKDKIKLFLASFDLKKALDDVFLEQYDDLAGIEMGAVKQELHQLFASFFTNVDHLLNAGVDKGNVPLRFFKQHKIPAARDEPARRNSPIN